MDEPKETKSNTETCPPIFVVLILKDEPILQNCNIDALSCTLLNERNDREEATVPNSSMLMADEILLNDLRDIEEPHEAVWITLN
jgi:hypothetical protein